MAALDAERFFAAAGHEGAASAVPRPEPAGV